MVRFSLSPQAAVGADDFKAWRDLDELESSSSSDDDGNSSESSEELPHPLGFAPSYGRTRFFVDRPRESVQEIRQRLGYRRGQPHDFLEDDFMWDEQNKCQSFPPLDAYLDRRTAPASELVSYSHQYDHQDVQLIVQDDSVDKVTQLLQAASMVDHDKDNPALQALEENGNRLLKLAEVADRELIEIRNKMTEHERHMDQQHVQAAEALKMLLKEEQEITMKVIQREKQERKKRDAAEEALREQQEAEEAEQERVQEVQRQQAIEEKAQSEAEEQKRQKERETRRKALAAEEAKKTEYIAKAKKLVTKLVELRASVEPFEKAKEVSKRRLHMKKTVRGKVNTLNPDPDKIKSVASEVALEIKQAREEDEQNKQQAQAGNTQITSTMARGKRYLVDLLASTAMVRCQAEGFNGPRGDGFPLACMLAMVSTEAKELVPILGAHIYTACPTAIPTLPHPSKDSSEEELMEGLGMAKDKKTGEYETFARFLSRTEGIVSLVAGIMASKPESHLLLGGHKSSIEWLDRFLGHLPHAPETLPLLTAPVLDAFLTGAGHMMASLFPEQFKKHLDVIMTDTIHRLDVGPIGEPRALRLKKTVEGGFAHFKTTLPSKAIPSLYLTSHGTGEVEPILSTVAPVQHQTAASPFGSSHAPSSGITSASPFGAPAPSSTATMFVSSNGPPLFAQTAQSNDATMPFESSGMSSSQNDDMAISQAAPIGPSSVSAFGVQSMAPSPFGASYTPFGGGPTGQSAGPFDASSSINPSPFGPGAGNTTPSTFGISSSQSIPFGGGQPNATPSTFGISSSQSTPFAGGQSNATPAPFGAPSSQPSPFGGSQQMTTPFGQPAPSGFENPFGGGGVQQTAPFGQSSSSNGFNTSNATSSFGGGGPSTSFGGGGGKGRSGQGRSGSSNKPPCKFYAQGKCRYGDKCRFSHESQGGGFTQNPFGGPRR